MRKPALTDEHKATIAYFSMEIAVVPQIPTYACASPAGCAQSRDLHMHEISLAAIWYFYSLCRIEPY
jgi:hypothetical protein